MFATLRQKKMVWAEFEERYESDSMRQGSLTLGFYLIYPFLFYFYRLVLQ